MVHVLWLESTLLYFIKVELIVDMKFDHLLIHPAMVTLKNQSVFSLSNPKYHLTRVRKVYTSLHVRANITKLIGFWEVKNECIQCEI